MFCPDGFICLGDLIDRIHSAVATRLGSGDLKLNEIEELRGTGEPTDRAMFLYPDHPHMISKTWADEAALRFLINNKSDFWIMPPNGRGEMLRLSPRAFAANGALYEINGSDKSKKIPVRYNTSDEYRDLNDREDNGESIVVSDDDIFYFIDMQNGLIRIPYINDDLSDFVLYTTEAKVLAGVAGWIVCWKLPSAPLTDEGLIQKAFMREADTGDVATPPRRGPPHQHEKVWARFCKHYPSGDKGNDTWEVVASVTGLSRSSIRRAMEWAAKNRGDQVKPETNLIPF